MPRCRISGVVAGAATLAERAPLGVMPRCRITAAMGVPIKASSPHA
jgi:hypothetical protein